MVLHRKEAIQRVDDGKDKMAARRRRGGDIGRKRHFKSPDVAEVRVRWGRGRGLRFG